MATVDEQIKALSVEAPRWANLHLEAKLRLIQKCLKNIRDNIDLMLKASFEKRGITLTENSECISEALIMSSIILATYLSTLHHYWSRKDTKFECVEGEEGPDCLVKVGPHSALSKAMIDMGELFVQTKCPLKRTDPWTRKCGVAAVLGASNYDAPVDMLSHLFISNCVVIYKFAPMGDYHREVFTKIFEPLLAEKCLVFAPDSSVETGQQMIHHPLVTQWGLTGAKATACRLIAEARAEESKAALLSKSYIIETGSCTPYIVVPGKWTDAEIDAHAKYFVTAHILNGGHVCVHPQVLVTCNNWSLRKQFLEAVRHQIESVEAYKPFFPNAQTNLRKAEEIIAKEAGECQSPPESLVTRNGLKIVFQEGCSQTSKFCTEEMFCAAAVEIPLDTETPTDFMEKAVAFVNSKLSGSLAATVVFKPSKNEAENEALNRAVKELKYGTVCINAWPSQGFIWPQLQWGGYPGIGTLDNIDSGINSLGNCLGFEGLVKGIVKYPFSGPHLNLQSHPSNPRAAAVSQKVFRRIVSYLCEVDAGALMTVVYLAHTGLGLVGI